MLQIVLNLKGRPNGTLMRMMMTKKEGRNFVLLLLIFLLFLAHIQQKQKHDSRYQQKRMVTVATTSTSLSAAASTQTRVYLLEKLIVGIIIIISASWFLLLLKLEMPTGSSDRLEGQRKKLLVEDANFKGRTFSVCWSKASVVAVEINNNKVKCKLLLWSAAATVLQEI